MPPCVCAILETDKEARPVKGAIENLAAEHEIECLYYPEDAEKILEICRARETKKRFVFADIVDSQSAYDEQLRRLMWGFAKKLDITVFASVPVLNALNPKILVDSLKFIVSDAAGFIVLYDPDPEKSRRLTRLSVLLED